MVDAVRVLLLALAAVLLEFGVLGEVVEAGEFGLVGVGAERFAVDGDEAGDVAVFGFDDELGGVAALVDPAEQVLQRVVGLFGVQPVLDGATDQCGGVERRGGALCAEGAARHCARQGA